jgi:hypothetical protein
MYGKNLTGPWHPVCLKVIWNEVGKPHCVQRNLTMGGST